MRRRIVGTFTRLLLLLAFATPQVALAALDRVGPTNTVHGFPDWYQDKTSLIMDFCTPMNQSELDGGWCLLLPPAPPSAPEVFPGVFSDEHFYWAGDAGFTATVTDATGAPVTVNALLVTALEAAFAAGAPIPGDQLVFGRVRIILKPVPLSGTYTVYTPFGVYDVKDQVADPAGRLFFTEDIGIACPPGRFDCALASNIGPFLLPSNTPGGAELPPVPVLDEQTGCAPSGVCDPFWPVGGATPYPGTGKTYITNPARHGPVTGSVFPPFASAIDGVLRNHNTFRIEFTPAGAPAGTVPTLIGETNDFALMGRAFSGAIGGRVTLDRASYAQPVATPTGKKVDVFATALPTSIPRMPAELARPPVQPQLVFYDAPCGVDPVTGALVKPVDPTTGLPMTSIPMSSALGWKYVVGQSHPAAIPTHVCLEQTNGTDANLNAISIFAQAPVTDQIFLTGALFDPNTGNLTVSATSSDRLVPPQLTVGGYGPIDPATGQLVMPLVAPPNKVTVVSSAGGLNQRQVSTVFWATQANSFPVAVNDAVTILEDSPATAIAVMANDTMAGAALPTGIVTLASPPTLGTAVVNLDGTVSYTPNPNAFGTDGFTYTVDLNGFISNIGAVAVTLAPVNDVPVAVNDSFAAAIDTLNPLAVPLNVFANDIDADGKGDLDLALGLTQTSGPAAATITGGAGGAVSFTTTVPGTYTFTYQAQDKGGGAVPAVPALSNVATATVVAAPETLTITSAEYTTRQNRWVIRGNASPSAGQTVTIKYFNGVSAGQTIGTAVVAGGTWTLDLRPATGPLDPRDPTNAGFTSLVVTGPAGGTAVATFRIK